mgnify:CR=1 FL=1
MKKFLRDVDMGVFLPPAIIVLIIAVLAIGVCQ